MTETGRARLIYFNGAWQAFDEAGASINISASQTSGLQEIINYGFNATIPIEVIGPIGAALNCSVPVVFPPGRRDEFYLSQGVRVVFSALGNSPCITFDSLENCHIHLGGAVAQYSTDNGPVVLIKPMNGAPNTGNITIAASDILIGTTVTAANGTGTLIDLSYGGANGNRIAIEDNNGGLTALQITDPGAANIAFMDNQINYGYLHRFSQYGIRVGMAGTNKANIKRNKWYCGRLSGNGAASVAFSTWAGGDDVFSFSATNEEGPLNVGIQFMATGNRVFGYHIDGAATPISGGTGNSFY